MDVTRQTAILSDQSSASAFLLTARCRGGSKTQRRL